MAKALNNDIAYINKKMTEAFDLLGGNTKEYRLWVEESLGVRITSSNSHKSKHVSTGTVGQLKLLNNNKKNNKQASYYRDVANSLRATPKDNKSLLEELQNERAIADMFADMMSELYEFITTDSKPEEMEGQLYESIQNLFYTSGKPTKAEIERVYTDFSDFMVGQSPQQFTTEIKNPVTIPDVE